MLCSQLWDCWPFFILLQLLTITERQFALSSVSLRRYALLLITVSACLIWSSYGRLLQVEGKLFCIRDKWHAWLSFFFLSKVNFIFWCLLQEDLDRGWDDLWPKMATTPAGALETKVDLRLACKNLKNKDIGSKSDPLVAVYQQDRDTWMEVGNNTQWQCLLMFHSLPSLAYFFLLTIKIPACVVLRVHGRV